MANLIMRLGMVVSAVAMLTAQACAENIDYGPMGVYKARINYGPMKLYSEVWEEPAPAKVSTPALPVRLAPPVVYIQPQPTIQYFRVAPSMPAPMPYYQPAMPYPQGGICSPRG